MDKYNRVMGAFHLGFYYKNPRMIELRKSYDLLKFYSSKQSIIKATDLMRPLQF